MGKIPAFSVYKPKKGKGLKGKQKKIKHPAHYTLKANEKLHDFIKRKVLLRDGRKKSYIYEDRIYHDKTNYHVNRWFDLSFHWELSRTSRTPAAVLNDTYTIAGKKLIHADIRALSLEVLRFNGYKILSDRENIQIIDSYGLTVFPWTGSYTIKKYKYNVKRSKRK